MTELTQEQLDSGAKFIFYMTRGEDRIDKDGEYTEYSIRSIKLGEQ